MLAAERHRKILDLLQDQQAVRTVYVAKCLNVTEETVRRDFEKLEADGLLARSHGGAVRVDADKRDLPLSSRETEQVGEKQRIAALAAKLVQPGETILLDASSTAAQLAAALPDMALTVLTNGLPTAFKLLANPSMRVVLLGGELDHRSLSCQGPFVEQALDCYHVQKAFVSCRGVDAERGLSEASSEHARFKRRILDLADATYLLADHTKLGLKSTYFFAKLAEVEQLITDQKPPKGFEPEGTTLAHP